MDLIWFLLVLFLFGLILGALGRVLVSGTSGMGVMRTSLAGILGSLTGGLVTRYLVEPKADWVEFLIAVILAAVFVAMLAPRRGAPRHS